MVRRKYGQYPRTGTTDQDIDQELSCTGDKSLGTRDQLVLGGQDENCTILERPSPPIQRSLDPTLSFHKSQFRKTAGHGTVRNFPTWTREWRPKTSLPGPSLVLIIILTLRFTFSVHSQLIITTLITLQKHSDHFASAMSWCTPCRR